MVLKVDTNDEGSLAKGLGFPSLGNPEKGSCDYYKALIQWVGLPSSCLFTIPEHPKLGSSLLEVWLATGLIISQPSKGFIKVTFREFRLDGRT